MASTQHVRAGAWTRVRVWMAWSTGAEACVRGGGARPNVPEAPPWVRERRPRTEATTEGSRGSGEWRAVWVKQGLAVREAAREGRVREGGAASGSVQL